MSSEPGAGGAVPPLASVRCGLFGRFLCVPHSPRTVLVRLSLVPHPTAPPPLRSHARIDEWSPAFVLYTSGSTAAPKAVPLTHAGPRHALGLVATLAQAGP